MTVPLHYRTAVGEPVSSVRRRWQWHQYARQLAATRGAGYCPYSTTITSFSSPELGQRQSYTVTMVKNGISTPLVNASGGQFFAVPTNVGPRTMNYPALLAQGTYSTQTANVKVFAGTVDDPFSSISTPAFDTLNLRSAINGGVLTPEQDASLGNVGSETVSGYAVNTIAIELPVSTLTTTRRDRSIQLDGGYHRDLGNDLATPYDRPSFSVAGDQHRCVQPDSASGQSLVNELLIGTGDKDRWSMDVPKNNAQFSGYFLDPTLARVLNAATGGAVAIPTPPRVDWLLLVTYAPPIAAPGRPRGPVADLLQLDTGVHPAMRRSTSRLELLYGDAAGYPYGRRLFDDVVDNSLRGGGGVSTGFQRRSQLSARQRREYQRHRFQNNVPVCRGAPRGRDRRHINPAEPGCTGGTGAACSACGAD